MNCTISLDGTSSVPLYEQIYKYIKIRYPKWQGNAFSGERLPSTRELAKYLQVSRSTTVDLAYEQLRVGGVY